MQYEVYADLLFLINFSMDFLCLFLTSKILSRKIHILRTLASSVTGGIYSILALFINAPRIVTILIDITVCTVMCVLCFFCKGKKIKQYFTEICVYLICGATLGGIMTVLFNMLNKLDLHINSGGDNISAWIFLILALISGFAAVKGSNFLTRQPKGQKADTEIIFDGKSIILHGITDTGNMLRDPASGKPVIVTDIKSTLPLLPYALQKAVALGRIEMITELPDKYSARIRIIPSNSVAGKRLLIGIIPDKILIHNARGTTDVSAVFAPASLPGLPDDCNAIIPGGLNI